LWRTPDGIIANLRKLCSKAYFDRTRPPGLSPNIKVWAEVGWRDFDPARLSELEIVAFDVDVISAQSIPVADFTQMDAIQNAPLNRRERREEHPPEPSTQ
jgi:hypothetical protein